MKKKLALFSGGSCFYELGHVELPCSLITLFDRDPHQIYDLLSSHVFVFHGPSFLKLAASQTNSASIFFFE